MAVTKREWCLGVLLGVVVLLVCMFALAPSFAFADGPWQSGNAYYAWFGGGTDPTGGGAGVLGDCTGLSDYSEMAGETSGFGWAWAYDQSTGDFVFKNGGTYLCAGDWSTTAEGWVTYMGGTPTTKPIPPYVTVYPIAPVTTGLVSDLTSNLPLILGILGAVIALGIAIRFVFRVVRP